MSGSGRGIALALGVAALSGCSAPYNPALFSLQASRADYPVMLSRVPRGGSGRPLHAHAEMGDDTVSARTGRYTTTTWTRKDESSRSVSEDLALQAPTRAGWIQIDGLVYSADDLFQSFGFVNHKASKREVDVEGAIHR